MAKLTISHHERVDGHPHRWRVHIDGRPEPVVVHDIPWDTPVRLLQTHFIG